ncbi:CoA-binding protein [Burkholderia sp. Ac-20353]|uniref:CoA-binding protein n=1 Tax=Burkholderia sp. Ac-20353 TaxID=2703894 RepID=UPI00197B3213|nr:CoA-binding protein [Burkholderia sp. Ac-20353]MBN3788701.1 CoA-binding protein [Burkholderia sp. Ac-20353]
MSDDSIIRKILKRDRIIAIVGLSDKPYRPSHGVAEYMQQAGYRIVPVNPMLDGQRVLGERCYASLPAAAAALARDGVAIGMVDVFRKSSEVAAVADDAIAIGARSLWLQLGVIDEAAAARARAAGLDVVMDHCALVEHRRLGVD